MKTAQLLVRNKPTHLLCLHNQDYEMQWDSDQPVFFINHEKRHGEINHMIGEMLVYSPSFDFKSVYIARQEDFDQIEMF